MNRLRDNHLGALATLIAVLGLAVILSGSDWWWQHAKPLAETWKVWAEFLAYGAAAGYFGFKLWSGYFISDLSLSVTCKRQRNPAKQSLDVLSATVTMKAGGNGTIKILDCKGRVAGRECAPEPRSFGDFWRLDSAVEDGREAILSFDHRDHEAPLLNLAPGDSTQMALIFDVPKDSPCIVEVAILGIRFRSHHSKRPQTMQWRASEASLPLSYKAAE